MYEKVLPYHKRIIGESYYESLNRQEKKLVIGLSKNMTLLQENGTTVGRLLLYENGHHKDQKYNLFGVVTVGGFKTSNLTGLIGILIGESYRASRDVGVPIALQSTLKRWSTNQAELLSKSHLDEETQIECASVIRCFDGETADLKLAYYKGQPINYDILRKIISATSQNKYILVQDAAIFNYERDNSCKIDLLENVFYGDVGIPGILQTRNIDAFVDWPKHRRYFHSQTLVGLVIEAIRESWNISIEDILQYSNISSDDNEYEAVVGFVNGNPITIDNVDIINKPK